jgi:hypothetical protein
MDAFIRDFEADNCDETARLYGNVILALLPAPPSDGGEG